MDSSDEAYFNEIMGNNLVTDITTIKNKLEELFKEAIQSEIYDAYTPIPVEEGGYERTFMFRDSVKAHVSPDGDIYIYSDINSGYYSAVTGEDVSQYLSGFIQGHSDGIGIDQRGQNQYHIYQKRNYLQKAQALIKSEYPLLNVEIIEDDNF